MLKVKFGKLLFFFFFFYLIKVYVDQINLLTSKKFFKWKNYELWKTDIDTEMNNDWRSLTECVFLVLLEMSLLLGRDLKIEMPPTIVNTMSLYSSSIHIRETTWHVAKTTNRRSKGLVKQRKCQQSQCCGSAMLCQGLFLNVYISAVFCFFPSNTPHTLSSVNTGSLAWNSWMFTLLRDGVQIQMAIKMGQSKWMAWVSVTAAL